MIQQQPQILQQQQEQGRQLQGAQAPRRPIEDDIEDDGGMMGWRYGHGWRHHQDWGRGAMGPGTMGRGGVMGRGSMGHPMMMRMLFAMMDSDDDGTVSLQEFQGGSRADLQGDGRQQRWPTHPRGDPGLHARNQDIGSAAVERGRSPPRAARPASAMITHRCRSLCPSIRSNDPLPSNLGRRTVGSPGPFFTRNSAQVG
jgi:hypothetical protein